MPCILFPSSFMAVVDYIFPGVKILFYFRWKNILFCYFFACTIPCHQAIVYRKNLFEERGYDTSYVVRADYEHFLWCYFVKKANMCYLGFPFCRYEGGGFSEGPEQLKISDREHRLITQKYMDPWQLFLFRSYLILTLAPLRRRLAESKAFAGAYNSLVKGIYGVFHHD